MSSQCSMGEVTVAERMEMECVTLRDQKRALKVFMLFLSLIPRYL